MDNLRKLDLNLLLTLNALLIERNVTRAAQRLNLSQPSVSVQLGKLRAAFDDPLLLPGPRGMLPTARALGMTGVSAKGFCTAPSMSKSCAPRCWQQGMRSNRNLLPETPGMW